MAKHNNTQNYLEASTPEELAKLLGLPPAAGVEIKLRSDLNV